MLCGAVFQRDKRQRDKLPQAPDRVCYIPIFIGRSVWFVIDYRRTFTASSLCGFPPQRKLVIARQPGTGGSTIIHAIL